MRWPVALPPEKRFRCEILTWSGVARDSKKLSDIIKGSGFAPDIIVAIGRGGLVPARILSDYLHIKDLTSIKVEHWGIAATPDEKAVIKFPLSADIKGKRVLLVDDITDTGDTLRVSVGYLNGFGPGEVRTAVLVHKTTSEVVPDYYLRKVTKWRWIIFPWHICEDLTGFIRELRAEGMRDGEEIRRELKRRYNIDIKAEMVREALSTG
jgi:hypoxanthine phosphoribosyltransferase